MSTSTRLRLARTVAAGALLGAASLAAAQSDDSTMRNSPPDDNAPHYVVPPDDSSNPQAIRCDGKYGADLQACLDQRRAGAAGAMSDDQDSQGSVDESVPSNQPDSSDNADTVIIVNPSI